MTIQISYRNIIRFGDFHPNGGGFVESTTTVPKTVYIAPMAKVLDNADVRDTCQILGQAVVCENAIVKEKSIIADHSIVQGNAIVSQGAELRGYSVTEGQNKTMGGSYIDNVMLRRNSMVFTEDLEGFESEPNTLDNNV